MSGDAGCDLPWVWDVVAVEVFAGGEVFAVIEGPLVIDGTFVGGTSIVSTAAGAAVETRTCPSGR